MLPGVSFLCYYFVPFNYGLGETLTAQATSERKGDEVGVESARECEHECVKEKERFLWARGQFGVAEFLAQSTKTPVARQSLASSPPVPIPILGRDPAAALPP